MNWIIKVLLRTPVVKHIVAGILLGVLKSFDKAVHDADAEMRKKFDQANENVLDE